MAVLSVASLLRPVISRVATSVPGDLAVSTSRIDRTAASSYCSRAGIGSASAVKRSRTTPHAIHQSFLIQAVASENLLVALKVDRVGQLTEHLADELIRVPRTTQEPRGFLVRSRRR